MLKIDEENHFKITFHIEQDTIKRIIQNKVKIAYLWVKFSPRRRHVGKNVMKRTGKEIFCKFRISNQIFCTIYGSRDIERSLNTTFAVFGENLNFVDEYLLKENLF